MRTVKQELQSGVKMARYMRIAHDLDMMST